MEKDARYWIKKLNLKPHPEGGYYRETYKSDVFLTKKNSQKHHASLIYFLLKNNDISAFHKLTSDEIWLYHSGCSATIFMINLKGQLSIKKIGGDLENDENLLVTIPKNTWFAAKLNNKQDFCLMSCMVSPAFEWTGFELGKIEKLVAEYPIHKELFHQFCQD